MRAEGAAHGQRSQVPAYAIYVVCRIRVQAFGDVYTTCCYGRASRVAFLMSCMCWNMRWHKTWTV